VLTAVPGSRIAYREAGTGIPVVFLHGGTGTGEYDWGAIAARLSQGYRTVVLDQRGHGYSPDPQWEVGIGRCGLDLTHVLRAIGVSRAVLVGFSMGASTLLKLLGRDSRWAIGLVTVGAAARGDVTRVEEIMSGPWPQALIDLEHAVTDDPDHWEKLRGVLVRDWAANLAFSAQELQRISCPTLVCQGERDRIHPPEHGRELAGLLPDAEFALIPAAGHAAQLDQPKAFGEAIEAFLARVSPPRG
jgi:pimeloyl-ACP methyl ester carboxylesterase